ncbi:glycosyltransferase family 2 protein [Sinirhodobacter populi]|uniref:Glycosyltransferase family 2 protein n=1 Tax=Paenirhodobacter populi TaxID=2306993 RepID=A0A443JWD0_9RHOB|nr:glycosyltransferase family 2 protein [Sinirhodobacter populi]RWR24799.1 glycosyltransferase family 2 protein [Sinirhodobacter populi]
MDQRETDAEKVLHGALNKSRSKYVLFTQVKDEGPFLKEWVAYHKIIGFDDIVLLDNDSTDESADILRDLASRGLIHLINWPRISDSDRPQIAAFDMLCKFIKENRPNGWVAFIDADEFISLPKAKNIVDFMSDKQSYHGIALNWRIFGSSGRVEPPNDLVINSYTQRARDAFPANRHVKSIINMKYLEGITGNSHYFIVADSSKYVFPNMEIFPGCFNFLEHSDVYHGNTTSILDEACVYHYIIKSKADWIRKKSRGRATLANGSASPIDETYFATHDRNEINDFTMLPWGHRVNNYINFYMK